MQVTDFAPVVMAVKPNSRRVHSVKVNVHRGLNVGYVLMILPQVHLRKPCYDFYFL